MEKLHSNDEDTMPTEQATPTTDDIVATLEGVAEGNSAAPHQFEAAVATLLEQHGSGVAQGVLASAARRVRLDYAMRLVVERFETVPDSSTKDLFVKAVQNAAAVTLMECVFTRARRFGGICPETDELAQEAFVAILPRLSGFQCLGAAAATNFVGHYVRSAALRRNPLEAIGILSDGATPSPDQALELRDLVRAAEKAAKIDADDLALVVAHHIMNLTIPELAVRTGLKRNTVKYKIQKALKSLHMHVRILGKE